MRAGHLTHAVHPWLMAREFGLLPLIHPFRRQQTHLLHVVNRQTLSTRCWTRAAPARAVLDLCGYQAVV